MELSSPTAGTRRTSGRCPRCGAAVEIHDRPLVGEVLRCERCRRGLEVVGIEPLAVAPVAKIEEDEEDFFEV